MAKQLLPDETARWTAVLTRDPAADGQFVYAVTSTGVYCRPTCPSRRPRRDRVRFFPDPAAAAAAGFRPCQRCRPDGQSRQEQIVASVRTLLDERDPPPTLAELGAAVGLSPSHLQRLFRRATGLSPREYVTARCAQRLKTELRRGATVTDALYDAGYGSSRALYEEAHRHLGKTPGTYRRGGAGMSIAYAAIDTELGPMLLAATDRGICALSFGDPDELVQQLAAEFPCAGLRHDPAAVAPYIAAVQRYFTGEQRQLDLPLDLIATAFQRRVWDALRQIPYGATRSYEQIAAELGNPRAARAVARACATNPVSLVIPCHRVLGKDGSHRGYAWGLERKRQLLERERRW